MNDRFKFRIAVYERQQNDMPWVFVEYIDPDNQHWGLNQCGDIISDSSYWAHHTRKNAPDSVHRVYEPEMCTGLSDENGKLIYIGDIIKCGNGPLNTATVEYANGENFIDGIYPFNLYHDCGDECHCQLRDYPEYACEIIGNIHEQAKQKD